MREGWELMKLSDLFDVKSSKRVHKADWRSEGIPFYRAREVVKLAEQGFVDNDLFISQELYTEFTQDKGAPKEGDIIISAVGTLGQCYLVKPEDKFYFKDASVLWFEKYSDVYSRYVDYAFKSDMVMKQVLHKSMGATVGTLTISRAKNILIPIPPVSEQKQIVAILDKAFAAIDQAKANIEKNIENAKELFQSKLNEIFSQKGDGWEEKKLNQICDIKGRIGYRGYTKADLVNKGEGAITLSPSNITNNQFHTNNCTYISWFKYNESPEIMVFEDDILFVKTGSTYGKVAIVKDLPEKATINPQFVVFKDIICENRFLYYALLTREFREKVENIVGGTATPTISQTNLGNQIISIPNYNKQLEIAQILDDICIISQKIEAVYNKKLNNLDDLKKSILQKTFSGELTPNEHVV